MSDSQAFEFEVERQGRLDGVLREQSRLSVKQAKELIKNGALSVNGYPTRKPAFEVFPGDRITVTALEEKPETEKAKPERAKKPEPAILYEDAYFIALQKPSGLLSVPTSHSKEKSALDWLEGKVYAVHRLDRDASGLLLFAKDFETRCKLMEQFKKRKVEKTYLAIVAVTDGRTLLPESLKGEIEIPIEDNRYQPYVTPHKGKHARTLYEVVAQKGGFALVRATTRTGRRHQVRVHLAQTVGAILGDSVYGEEMPSDLRGVCGRLCLHGESVSFFHPAGGGRHKIEAPVAGDMKDLAVHLELLQF